MIELLNINGTPINDIDYVEYLGSDFSDSEITNFNEWSRNAIAPRFAPIRKAQFSTAEVRFLVSGTPTQTELEEAITKLVVMLRDETAPELNYNGFSFVGHCIDYKADRISGGRAAELTLTIEGFKCIIETIQNPRTFTDDFFSSVLIESPMVITFSAMIGGATITVGGDQVHFNAPVSRSFEWNGLTHTLSAGKAGTPTDSSIMDKLIFPYARVGGTSLDIIDGQIAKIKCYRRIL